MQPIVITVPCDPQRTSPNVLVRTPNPYAKGRRIKRARVMARLAWVAAGKPTSDGPVRVDVLIRRGRILDEQNAWSALKPHMDGIFVDGLTPNDGPAWVTLGTVTQETGKQWRGREEIVFTVQGVVT
jgi:hypothetical protein